LWAIALWIPAGNAILLVGFVWAPALGVWAGGTAALFGIDVLRRRRDRESA
jgi:hypothetical protein